MTTCSLATARAAIRATKAEVPSPASPQEPPVRADPALADQLVCFDRVLAVSIASGGTAGNTDVVEAKGGDKLGLFSRGDRLEVVQPVYRRRDPNCCPTGGYDRVLYRFDGRRLVVTRRWNTRLFRAP